MQGQEKNSPVSYQGLLEDLRRKKYFLIGYAGAHGIANALGCLVEAAGLLRQEKVCIVLMGRGQEKERLIRAAKERGLENIFFLPAVEKRLVPGFLQYMDALYIGLQKQPLFRFGISPNKIMDYMMAGKPIINAIEAGNDLVAEAGCGLSIPAGSPKAAADAILCMAQYSEEERMAMGKRGREFVLQHHDYRVLAKEFLQVLSCGSKEPRSLPSQAK